jgi:hypothetical protein
MSLKIEEVETRQKKFTFLKSRSKVLFFFLSTLSNKLSSMMGLISIKLVRHDTYRTCFHFFPPLSLFVYETWPRSTTRQCGRQFQSA